MVSPFHFDDAVAARGRASQANGVHGGLGAAAAKAHHFHREARANLLGQSPLHFVWHAEHGADVQALFNGADDCWMAVAGHQRAEAEIKIDVLVAIEVPDVPTSAFADEQRIRLIGTIIARYAEWDAWDGLLMGQAGARCALLVDL